MAEALLSSREVLRLSADSAGFKLPSAETDWQILLLDDLQDMQEEQDWNALCELIRACPERRFVLLSRGTPPGSLMAFQYTGLMTVLEADDLLFDADDVRRLLRLYGVEAADSEIDGILKESVGYPLGVAITAWCMSPGKPWTPELVARVFREVFLYFETAIYRRFDLPVRRFLLELAPFESFDLKWHGWSAAIPVPADGWTGFFDTIPLCFATTTASASTSGQVSELFLLSGRWSGNIPRKSAARCSSRGGLYYELKEDYAHAPGMLHQRRRPFKGLRAAGAQRRAAPRHGALCRDGKILPQPAGGGNSRLSLADAGHEHALRAGDGLRRSERWYMASCKHLPSAAAGQDAAGKQARSRLMAGHFSPAGA